MSIKEVDWQYNIIKSARAQGGYGGKWSSSVQVGKPDLILRVPGVTPGVLMEVKLLKNIPVSGVFDRQLDVTAKQREELRKHHEAEGVSCVGVVVYYKPTNVHLVVLPWEAERLTSGYLEGRSAHRKAQSGGIFDMKGLMGDFLVW